MLEIVTSEFDFNSFSAYHLVGFYLKENNPDLYLLILGLLATSHQSIWFPWCLKAHSKGSSQTVLLLMWLLLVDLRSGTCIRCLC